MAATVASSADPMGHYEALRLQPAASPGEIAWAYRRREEEWRQCRSFSRFAVQEAYRYLSDPERKAAYDAGPRPGPPEPSASRRRLILSAILLTLVSHAGFISPGFLQAAPPRFHPGDVLIRSHDERTLGTVTRQEFKHRFPRSRISRAYLIRTAEGKGRWFPARELERHYRRSIGG